MALELNQVQAAIACVTALHVEGCKTSLRHEFVPGHEVEVVKSPEGVVYVRYHTGSPYIAVSMEGVTEDFVTRVNNVRGVSG